MTAPHEKVLRRVERQPSGCWLFTGPLNHGGYGLVSVGSRSRGTKAQRLAHRVVYEALAGPIPEGMTLDHLCHNRDLACRGGKSCPHRRCMNPDHLEPASIAENSRRGRSWQRAKTHCPQGHPYDEANTLHFLRENGRWARRCRACLSERNRQRRENRVPRITSQMMRAAQTHCIHGHEFTPENTIVRANGTRKCRECGNRRSRESYQAKKREAADA